jgi:hypothetical protein
MKPLESRVKNRKRYLCLKLRLLELDLELLPNSTIDEDTSAAYLRRQSMVEKMTTISKDDGKSVHASESRLNDSELPSTRRIVKRRESLGDFRPTTRASAQQQNGERQLRPLKSRPPSPLRWTGENPIFTGDQFRASFGLAYWNQVAYCEGHVGKDAVKPHE